MPGRAYETLFELATGQYGYVTAEQATAAGFEEHTLPKMAERGRVTRVAQGVYRFNAFPHGPLDTYMEATLWPRGLRGYISHESALDFYDLSDVNPAKVHITLPPGYRVTREVPKLYHLHFEPLDPDEVTYREGIPVTTIERTLRDCHHAHLRRGLLEQALDQARSRGMLSRAREKRLRDEFFPQAQGAVA